MAETVANGGALANLVKWNRSTLTIAESDAKIHDAV